MSGEGPKQRGHQITSLYAWIIVDAAGDRGNRDR
jgi:hypothetical protein